MLRASLRRGSIIRLPQVRHSIRISAPSRTTFQSNPPHGWAFRIRMTSSSFNSGSMPRIISKVAARPKALSLYPPARMV